jgi:hypothetical protein
VSVCASVRPNKSRQTHSNRAKEVAFHVFCYNFACRPFDFNFEKTGRILRACDSESISFFSNFCFYRLQKQLKLLLGLCVCVCERQPFLPVRQSPEKKIWSFEVTSSKKWLKLFYLWYDQDRLVITNLPVCVKLLYKVCSQSYHDVIIKKSY